MGQNEETALTLVAVALVSLAAQYPKGTARFLLLDSTPPGFPQREFLERVIQAIPHEIIQVKPGDLAETMGGLAQELKNQSGDEPSDQAPETFLLIHGLQNFKKLRMEDEFGFSSGGSEAVQPAAVLQNLISEGAGLRIPCHRHLRHLQQREPFCGPEADERIRDARALPDERQRFRQFD